MKIITSSSNNLLFINFDQAQQREISLYDLSGNCLHKKSVNYETLTHIPLHGVANGVYILQVNGLFQKVYVD